MNTGDKTSMEIVEHATKYFNNVGAGRAELKRTELEKYFDEDVTSYIDDELMVAGIDGFFDRLTEMKSKVQFWETTPCDISLSEDNKAAGRYFYRFTDKKGVEGVIHIIAIWTLRNGKLYRMIEHTLRSGAGITLQARQ